MPRKQRACILQKTQIETNPHTQDSINEIDSNSNNETEDEDIYHCTDTNDHDLDTKVTQISH